MRRTSWPCLALTAVLLAGCSGDPEPKEPDSTADSTPPATPPPLPEAATQETAEGAEAFVHHYLDVLNYAKHSSDFAPLSDLSATSCEGCQRLVDAVERTYAQGGIFEGGQWDVGDLEIFELTSVWSATGKVVTTPGYQIPESGADRRESAETTANIEFQLDFVEGGWVMMSLSEAVV